MSAGFFDLLACWFGWKSSRPRPGTVAGPYYAAAGTTFSSGAVLGAVDRAAAATGQVSGNNVLTGWCHG
jgi:hypothetical protein